MKNFIILFLFLIASHNSIFGQSEIIRIPDNNWRLCLDPKATWQNDPLYLPGEFEIKNLPLNQPTEGWEKLYNNDGITIDLPSTVEEHFWGENGFSKYKNSYGYEQSDPAVKDGSYKGVSWWWTRVMIPESLKNKKVFLKIRGARLRAEVYVNKILTGYNIINEVSFKSDISKAIEPGKEALIAIRITNPGGQMDWIDPVYMKWGENEFHRSHGFGGLDRGLSIEVCDDIFMEDFWIQNTPDLKKVKAMVQITNTQEKKQDGQVTFKIKNSAGIAISEKYIMLFSLNANETKIIEKEILFDEAYTWTLNNPVLYTMEAKMQSSGMIGIRNQNFGFRWFDAVHIGEDATLEFNHQRIRVLSSISWGFWGLNGLFPTPDLAKKEVLAAKELGLNCLQFHRNVGKTDVFDQQDQIGLLRYMEPGGGITALGQKYNTGAFDGVPPTKGILDYSGKNGEANSFAEKFMQAKIVQMIKDHRSHPSLIMYVLQNEMSPDLNNPRIFNIIRLMHELDPSRIVALKSGVTTANQVWMRPYNDKVYCEDGQSYSGWADEHTVGGPGVWKDEFYKSPESFTHRSTNKKEIAMWGEMLGAAVPDNHELMVQQLSKKDGKSYDYLDHKEILDAYNQFLHKWKFKDTYKSAGFLFEEIGKKSYDFWGRVIETAKLSEENDFLVISGWESTAIENHSGLVDNLRNFKADPLLISKKVESIHPVIKTNSLVYELNDVPTLDLFLINESSKAHQGKMILSFGDKNDPTSFRKISEFEIPKWEANKFVYKIVQNYQLPRLTKESTYTLKAEIENTEHTTSDEVIAIQSKPSKIPQKNIGILGQNIALSTYLQKEFGIKTTEYEKTKNYDALIICAAYSTPNQAVCIDTIANTDDDPLYQSEFYGNNDNLSIKIEGIEKGKTKVTLKFAEVYFQYANSRVFDVDINGNKFLDDFDIFAEAGLYKAIDKTYQFDNQNNYISITFPECKKNSAKICAALIETASGAKIAYNFGGPAYKSKDGILYQEYTEKPPFGTEVFDKVKNGTDLILIPCNAGGNESYGRILKNAGMLQCKGAVGVARQPWMGSWIFTKPHALLKGLPATFIMSTYFQVGAIDSDGLLVDGDIDLFAGYGRDHDRNLGAAGFVANHGKGKIIYWGLFGLSNPENTVNQGIHSIVAKRIFYNTLNFVKK